MKKYLIFVLVFLYFSYNGNSQCNTISNFLGNDVSFCQGQQVTLNVPSGYNFYTWSNGELNTSNTVTQTEEIILTLSELSGNLVVNGDFEQGNTGFISEYAPGTGGSWGLLSTEGQFAISTSPSNVHNNFLFCNDHTSGSGNLFIANGSGIPQTRVWCQTINVDPSTIYQFSTWAMNVLNAVDNSDLQFLINNVQVGSIFSTSVTGCQWQQFYQEWDSGINTSAEICIVNQSTVVSGNDFALDDITFKKVCQSKDTVQITVHPLPVLTTLNDSICQNDPLDFAVLQVQGADNYSWTSASNILANFSDSIYVRPTQTTIYSVTGTDQNGCSSTTSVEAFVKPSFTIFTQNDSICKNSLDTLIATGADNYVWSPANTLSSSTGDTVFANPSATQVYKVIGEKDGCYDTSFVTLKVIENPIANFEILTEDLNINESITFQNSSQNASTYDWSFGNGAILNQVDNNNQYAVYGNFTSYEVVLIAYESICSDTTSLIFEIKPDISIEFPNVFTPNAEDASNAFFSLNPINFKSYGIKIFNRWGNLMYEGDLANEKWNGKTNENKDASDGIYYYLFEGVGLNDVQQKGQGFFHLVR